MNVKRTKRKCGVDERDGGVRTTGGGQNQPAPLAASTDGVRELSRGDRAAYSRMDAIDHAYNCMISEISYSVNGNGWIVLLIPTVERCIFLSAIPLVSSVYHGHKVALEVMQGMQRVGIW